MYAWPKLPTWRSSICVTVPSPGKVGDVAETVDRRDRHQRQRQQERPGASTAARSAAGQMPQARSVPTASSTVAVSQPAQARSKPSTQPCSRVSTEAAHSAMPAIARRTPSQKRSRVARQRRRCRRRRRILDAGLPERPRIIPNASTHHPLGGVVERLEGVQRGGEGHDRRQRQHRPGLDQGPWHHVRQSTSRWCRRRNPQGSGRNRW